MVITVAAHKGGVGKSTTAVHLAAYLVKKAPTVLVDSDPNRSVCGWALNGNLPFPVIPLHQAARRTREFEHVVIDTNAGLRPDELKEIVEGCDLLITPTTPDALSYQALMVTVGIIQNIKNVGQSAHYKALLTIIPPRPSRDGDDMREELTSQSIPLFKSGIRRFVAYQKAALSGVPVYESNDPRAAEAWEDYLSLGKEILP
jgi:chromosome partitioning protein